MRHRKFWYCNVCGAQNHESDRECQYCECRGPECERDNCSDPRHFDPWGIDEEEQPAVVRARDARLIAAAPDMYGWLPDAIHIIEAYIAYSKTMAREYGRGFSPSGLAGHTDEYVLGALKAIMAKVGGKIAS